jgi:hypothetical protein
VWRVSGFRSPSPKLPRPPAKSITWLECEHAARLPEPKEALAFLVDHKHDWPIEQKEEYKLLLAVAQGKLAEVAAEVQTRVNSLGRRVPRGRPELSPSPPT